MPVTRSRTGKERQIEERQIEEIDEQRQPIEATSSIENENRSKENSDATLTPTIERTTERRNEETDRNSKKTPSKTSRRSKRSKQLLKAQEDLLKLRVKLEEARIARLREEEESDTEEEVDEADSVTTNRDTTRKVTEWLETSQKQVLAITEQPHEENTTKIEVHTSQPHVSQVVTPETPNQQIDISQLASAIALAAKSAPQMTLRTPQELPIYNGAYQEWLMFRAAYKETAGLYSEIENLARLRRSLKGNAREAVENLLIYNAKTEEIIHTLESRFGRPDAIALAELNRLKSLSRPTDSPRELCVFATRVFNIVTTLRTLEKTYYLYNPEVTKITIEKLSPAMRYRWFDYAAEQNTEEPDLLKLANFLRREADRCGPYAQPEEFKAPGRTYNARETTQKNFERKPYIAANCLVCDQPGHAAVKCEEFKKADTQTKWDLAKEKKLCFRCLRFRNKTHSCRPIVCGHEGCERKHHRMLHFSKNENSEIVSSTWTAKKSQAFLKIVPVRVEGPKKNIDTYALLDDGSTITLIDEEIAQRAGLRGSEEPLRIEGIGNTQIDTASSRKLNITLRGGGKRHRINARSISNLKLSPQTIEDEDLKGCKHLEDIIENIKYIEARPRVLIGQDNWPLLLAEDTKIGNISQPVASLTPLGWVLHGACNRTTGNRVHFVQQNEEIEDIDTKLKQFFSLEALTITPKQPQNDPEVQAMKILERNTVRTQEGRFQTTLLWKNEDVKLPKNEDYAIKRLEATEKKIAKNPVLKQKVIEEMRALVNKGYAELAPEQEREGRTWYLPCFPVVNPLKPEKVRMVHDAAAVYKGISLNKTLLTGPDLLQSLPGTLMRMRQHDIAVSADIAEMFLQIKIANEDRDALRYLWRDGDVNATVKKYRMTSLIFGATSSPATAIFVKNKNAEDYIQEYPAAVDAIKRNHYMDDYIQSFENEDIAIETARQVRLIHSQAHFELRKWASNSTRVLQELGAEKWTEETEITAGDRIEKVLGMAWQTTTDTLKYNLDFSRLPEDVLQRKPTKRQVLRVVMSLFDPLGFVSPVTMKAKQLLQQIWKRSKGWDEPLEEDLATEWTKWTRHLEELKKIAIPRAHPWYSAGRNLQLHVFVDASEVAYSAALYWRAEDEEGNAHVSLIIAKARVAPLKVTSIPRLELQAAVMGSRIANNVIEEHDRKPERRFFWTDSKTVLTWLRTGSRSYKPFVAHRIAELEESTKTQEWRWVPTKANVADDSTREVPKNFNENHRWFTGPSFLHEKPEEWPQETSTAASNTGEEKTLTIVEKTSTTYAIPDPVRFSKWERLVRSTARVLQFIEETRQKTAEKTTYSRTIANKERDPTWGRKRKEIVVNNKTHKAIEETYKIIPSRLLIAAEKLIVKTAQEQSFSEDIGCLQKKHPINSRSKLRKIAVELVDNVIVIKSRIDRATEIEDIAKTPPVLDGRNHISKLYIEHTHQSVHHQGVEATINQCRLRFHIIGIRSVARQIIHRCIPCRKRKAIPSAPPTGDHPIARLAHHQRPFTHTGIDYFGPLTTTFGRATRKTYVALFTCLTTRAVHLEMANTLSTDSAVMALRRFIARRGCPKEIWSDNGTNLHGADKELRKAIDSATQEQASRRRIHWRFIPPSAPFMGGAWERLVRSVKTALSTVLNDRPISEEILVTLLAEVEMTVNSRPLTHVSVDPEDPEALTPNHFIMLGPAHEPHMGECTERELVNKKHWKTSQGLADEFWRRWLREYLPGLQERREPYGRGPTAQLGDLVLIVDNTLPRNTWPLGRIEAVYPGPDGVVRTVDVKTKGGTLRRPTKKLVILDAATVARTTESAS